MFNYSLSSSFESSDDDDDDDDELVVVDDGGSLSNEFNSSSLSSLISIFNSGAGF